MIHVYTGNGKGKTTASLGLIVRSLGRDNRVCLIQFMKKNYTYGEIRFLSQFDKLDIFQFCTPNLINPDDPDPIDFEEAEKAYQKAKDVINAGEYNLIVIDEINVAVSWKLLSLEKQMELLDLETSAEIVMTGRYASDELIEKADLVTEMKEIKHYYNAGVNAREGVEF